MVCWLGFLSLQDWHTTTPTTLWNKMLILMSEDFVKRILILVKVTWMIIDTQYTTEETLRVSFCLEYTMNVYVNLKPNNYDGETDLLTIEVPASYTEELLRHVRPIAEQKNTTEDKILKDIIKEAVNEIERRSYERKSRKNKKR